MANYISPDDLRAFIQDSSLLNTVSVEDACESASREVEELCGRYFTQDSTTSARTFFPYNSYEVCVDDISTTAGLAVLVDTNGDGTYDQTWTLNTDFFLEPVNPTRLGITFPYKQLTATLASKYFITRMGPQYMRPTVQVTAKWGWAAVPIQVKTATKILAARTLALGNAPLDVYGGNEFGQMRVQPPRSAVNLLRPFMLDEYAVA